MKINELGLQNNPPQNQQAMGQNKQTMGAPDQMGMDPKQKNMNSACR